MKEYEISLNDKNMGKVKIFKDNLNKDIKNSIIIFNIIEEIKKYNNIKTIKKNTLINILVPEIYLNNLNINKNNIDKESLLNSKIYFINKACEKINIQDKSKTIKDNFNNYKDNKEYDFLTDKEKTNELDKYLNEVDNIIKDIEENSNYKYGKDFIIPIKINNLNVD